MQKHKNLVGVSMALLAVLALAACQKPAAAPVVEPAQPAQEIIKSGIKKLTGVPSLTYDLNLKGDMKEGDKTGNFSVASSGGLDLRMNKDPRLTLKLDGSVSSDGNDYSAGLDFRFNNEAVNFNLMKLSIAGTDLPPELTSRFNKWWKITIPAQVKDELFKSLPTPGKDSTLTPEQQKLKNLFENTNFFSTPVYLGTADVKGEQSYHYSVNLDKAALINFVKETSEMQEGTKISNEELATAAKNLESLDVKGEVWIGTTSGVLNKISATAVKAENGDNSSGTLDLQLTLGDFYKPVNIDAPKDAEEFPIQEFLGPLMQLSGSLPSADLGSSDTEQSEMMTLPMGAGALE